MVSSGSLNMPHVFLVLFHGIVYTYDAGVMWIEQKRLGHKGADKQRCFCLILLPVSQSSFSSLSSCSSDPEGGTRGVLRHNSTCQLHCPETGTSRVQVFLAGLLLLLLHCRTLTGAGYDTQQESECSVSVCLSVCACVCLCV